MKRGSQQYFLLKNVFQKESDIKDLGFCDITFVPFSRRKPYIARFTHIASGYIARAMHEYN